MEANIVNLNEGASVKGLYRGVPYSGTAVSFNFDLKQRVLCVFVVLDQDVTGGHIATRKAGDFLKVAHGVNHSTIETCK